MLVKQTSLTYHLPKNMPAVFVLTGQEPLQQQALTELIKFTWQQQRNEPFETTVISVNASSDWLQLEQEANSYHLFSSTTFIVAHYDKKTLDAGGKTFFERYLKQTNPDCLILLKAPDLPLKQLTNLANHERVHVFFITAPSASEVKQWLNNRLKKICAGFDPSIPAMIQQYNEGNLLACSQLVDKLELLHDKDQTLTTADVEDQLVNQCDYALYDLTQACLCGDKAKALLLLRQSAGNKTEPTLVLWLLSQEVRLLLQLQSCRPNTQAFKDKASQLKIWSNRISLYQSASGRLQSTLLTTLLHFCNKLDNDIKTGQNGQIWNSFELIALSLCSGQQIGCLA